MSISIHYAVQICDTKNNQRIKRICGPDRTLLSKKSIQSLLSSIEHAAIFDKSVQHILTFFQDSCSNEIKKFTEKIQKKYSNDNIKIDIKDLKPLGIMNSILNCWNWLEQNGCDIVYQIQDDYIYYPEAIKDMIDMFYKIYKENNTHPIIYPLNDHYHWITQYKNRSTPRLIVPGRDRYWIQIYDIPCCFLTSKLEFSKHWNLYNKFLNTDLDTGRLEADSLNLILTQQGVLGLAPIQSLANHMQSELDIDPFMNWQELWNSIST